MKVVVIGASGHGRQVIDAIEASGEHDVVGVLDRALEPGTEVVGYPVLGGDTELAELASAAGARGYVVAIGDNFTRGLVADRAAGAAPDLELVSVVHPSAVVARDAVFGPGTVLLARSVVSNGSRLGRGVLLGTGASLDHDGVVGDFASLAPGVTTGGGVRIGRYTAVALGADVLHDVTVGEHTVVGAGALVLDDVPDLVVMYGVPARVVRGREPGEPYLRRRSL